MIISPIPRGLVEQLKVIPLSLVFLTDQEYSQGVNLRASLLVVYSITAYLLISSNLNITALPFLLRALIISTLSLLPAVGICVLWVTFYRVELDFLHNISKVVIFSTILLLLPPFPGTTNIVDSIMVVQYIIFICSMLPVSDNIIVSRLFKIDGWNLSLQKDALYYWGILSSARCYLQSAYLSLCSLYFIKFQPVLTKANNVRLKHLLPYKKAHAPVVERSLVVYTYMDADRQAGFLGLLYTTLILLISGRIWYNIVWRGSAVAKYSLQYYGIGELVFLYFNQRLTAKISISDMLIQQILYLAIFFSVGWVYFYVYRVKMNATRSQHFPRNVSQAFCRKGFHVLYVVVLLSLLSDPIVFLILSSIAVYCFCVLEAIRGRVSTIFHKYTQQFVTDKRSNVELSHILLLMSGSVFPAIYFLLWLAPGPPAHTKSIIGVDDSIDYSSKAWYMTIHFIHTRDTKMQIYDSFLSAGIVTTICADACAVYASVIFTYIIGASPRRYKDIFYIMFKSNLIVVSNLSEKKHSKTECPQHKTNNISHYYKRNIPVSLASTKTTCTGPSIFSRGCHNACLNKNRTFVGSVGFFMSSLLICTLLYGYPIGQSLILSIVTALAEAVSSVDNLILPFIFICFHGIMHYLF